MYRRTIVFIFGFLFITTASAQDNLSFLAQPQLTIEYKVTDRYKQSFALENRNFIYKDADWNAQVKHLEVSHFSRYEYKKGNHFGVGVRYRFEENFQRSKENEFRLLQQYAWKQKKTMFILKQRIRNEQRFYASITKYRFRYELGIDFPIGKSFGTVTYFKTATESLLEIAHTQKPEWEQRLSGVFTWQFSKKTDLELGVQYRLGDYTQKIGHELFLIAGLGIEL